MAVKLHTLSGVLSFTLMLASCESTTNGGPGLSGGIATAGPSGDPSAGAGETGRGEGAAEGAFGSTSESANGSDAGQGNSGGNTGGTTAAVDAGDTAVDAGDTAADAGDTAADAGDTAADAGEGDTTDPVEEAPSLNQAAWNGAAYEFGFESIDTIPILDAPADTDWSRWAMLHDTDVYRLYFMREGSDSSIYQFGFNGGLGAYVFGYASIEEISITGIPADADTSQFAMLHDGEIYRLYFLSQSAPLRLYQFGFNAGAAVPAYQYGYRSLESIAITGAPAGTDFSGYAMLHDGAESETYRFYAFASAAHTSISQFGYNPVTEHYEYGFNSIATIPLWDIPADSDTSDFAMLHDGLHYRLYMLTRP